MNDTTRRGVDRVMRERRKKSIWKKICTPLACILVFATFYALTFPAITKTQTPICGLEEHSHTPDCSTRELICGLEENDGGHTHSEDCYTQTLSCSLTEHMHSESCYPPDEPEELLEETAAETENASEPGNTGTNTDDESGYAGAETDDESGLQENTEELPTEPVLISAVSGNMGTRTMLRMASSSAAPVGEDIRDYIKAVTVQRQSGGAYVEDTVFSTEETVRVTILYEIDQGIVTAESRTVYYDLPDGMEPLSDMDGKVIDNSTPADTVVGEYGISEGGRIQIVFYDDFASGNAISGAVQFRATVYANGDGSPRTIAFGGEGGSITVYVPEEDPYDLSVSKSGGFTDGTHGSASYTITVGTVKGTGDTVRVTDRLTVSTNETVRSVAYDEASFRVILTQANGTMMVLDGYSLTFDSDGMGFELTNLPALAASESLNISYNIDLDALEGRSIEIKNQSYAYADGLRADTSYIISYICDISKTGSFNEDTGVIDWVVTINPDRRSVAGWSIRDELPYASVGGAVIFTELGAIYAQVQPDSDNVIRYTFPDNAPAVTYTMRYSTTAPSVEGYVSNEVTLINESGTETVVGSSVRVTDRQEDVEKTSGAKYVSAVGTVRTSWSFVITLTGGNMRDYSFTDHIGKVIDVQTGAEADEALHYALASELDESLCGNLRLISDGREYYYGDDENDYVDFTLTYYDAEGHTVSASDDRTPVYSFTVAVSPKSGSTFHGYRIAADSYPTILEATGLESGKTWSYENRILTGTGAYSRAASHYKKSTIFEKQVLNANQEYTSADTVLQYSACGGILNFRLVMSLDAVEGDSILVSDTLPAGLRLVEGSPDIYFAYASLTNPYKGTFAQEGSFSYTTATNGDATTAVTFTGVGITNEMKDKYDFVCIVYQARLNDATIWNEYTETTRRYSNSAEWGGYIGTQTTTVENKPVRLNKTCEQVRDTNGGYMGVVEYRVLMNAGGEDLDPNSDSIELTDILASDVDAGLDLASVRLYEYDRVAEDHIGSQVQSSEYQLHYSDQEHRMTLTLPDSAAYILTYSYLFDSSRIVDGRTQVTNAVSLTGADSVDAETVLSSVESSASAWQSVVTVTKVDADNNGDVLPGVEFTLSAWDTDTGRWTEHTDDNGEPVIYTTNEAGQLTLTLTGTADLSPSTLYCLEETRAAPGYDTGDTRLYFICRPVNMSDTTIYNDAASGSGIGQDEITFFNTAGGRAVLTNTFTGVEAVVSWFRANGEFSDGALHEGVALTLLRTTTPEDEDSFAEVPASEHIANPAIIDNDSDWSYIWGGLPAADENGSKYYYCVRGQPVSGYDIGYENNEGITSGTIQVRYTAASYALPKTGSVGVERFYAIGSMLILSAVVLFFDGKRKNNQRRC